MNIDLFCKVLGEILSEKYGAVIKIKAERKDEKWQKTG